MWLLVVNSLVYLVMNVAGDRLTRKPSPVTPADVRCGVIAVLEGRLSHADPRHYDNVQRLAHLLVILDVMLLVLSGLVLWKPVQFVTPRELPGGYEVTRRTRFYAMAGAVMSVVVYLVIVALMPHTLLMMLSDHTAGAPSSI